MSLTKRLQALFCDQRFLFLLVGGVNTVFSIALFALLVTSLGPTVWPALSLCVSWTVSMVLVFFAYRRFVFRVSGKVRRDLVRFTTVNLGNFVLNLLALTVLTGWMAFPPIPSQVAITCVLVLLSYLGHKHFSFRRNSQT